MAWIELTNDKRNNRLSDDMCMTITTNGVLPDGSPRLDMVLRLSENLMKKSRLLVGDCVKILYDPASKLFLLRRSPNGGPQLAATIEKKKGGAALAKGKAIISRTRIMLDPITNIKPEAMRMKACESVSVDDEGIMFAAPSSFLISE